MSIVSSLVHLYVNTNEIQNALYDFRVCGKQWWKTVMANGHGTQYARNPAIFQWKVGQTMVGVWKTAFSLIAIKIE